MNLNQTEEQYEHAKALRIRAEEALRGKPVELEDLSTKDIQFLLHELQVHQAELTIQNEELRRVQLDLEISRDWYSDLYDFAPSGYCTLSEKGRILNANQTLADMLGVGQEKLLHRLLSEFVDGDSQDTYYLHCRKALKDHQRAVSEIQLVKQTGERLIIRIESKTVRGETIQLMVMLSDVTEQRQLENLQQENAVRMVLQRRLIEQSEKERVELARNLHDGPIQRLAGLGFSIQIVKEILKEHGIGVDANIQQMGEDIKELLTELRGICNNLRPPVLAKLGLRRALAENIEELQAKYPQTKIHLDLSDDPTRLPDHIALALYRIYQEAMNNINHHAIASDVWIRMRFDPQEIVFEIQDNGQGISKQINWDKLARQGHYGLIGMKERAEVFGGTLQLLSPDGQGVLLQVMIPYAR